MYNTCTGVRCPGSGVSRSHVNLRKLKIDMMSRDFMCHVIGVCSVRLSSTTAGCRLVLVLRVLEYSSTRVVYWLLVTASTQILQYNCTVPVLLRVLQYWFDRLIYVC
jgi:hypothetical protein